MRLSEQKDGEHVRTSRAQKNGSSDFPLFQLLLFLHQRDGVVMDGVRDLVTQSSSKLLCVLHEVKERIDSGCASQKEQPSWLFRLALFYR
jgi:hypothetical protein